MAAEVTSVADVMQRGVHTLGRNDLLAAADELMKTACIRHLPVLDADGKLCGVISQRDLFRGALLRALGFGSRAEEQLLNTVTVKEAMTENPITSTPATPLAAAARMMVEHKVGCLPVVDGEQLVGILTEGDFVRMAAL